LAFNFGLVFPLAPLATRLYKDSDATMPPPVLSHALEAISKTGTPDAA
jgi:hypothetical protein